MTLDKAALSAKLKKIKNLDDIRAISPGVAVAPEDRQEASFLAMKRGLNPGEAMAFEKAGWTFVRPSQGSAPAVDHVVVVDSDGHLKVVGHALTVKFQPTLSREAIEEILGSYGLSIRRAMGFSPNLFLVADAQDDVVSQARSLNKLDSVVYAEPVFIEPIESR